MSVRSLWDVVCRTGKAWADDRAPRIGAALAFYSTLTLSPVMAQAVAGRYAAGQLSGAAGHSRPTTSSRQSGRRRFRSG